MIFSQTIVRMSLLAWVLTLPTVAASAAEGDVMAGERAWQQRCAACHALDTDRFGPRHRGVVGRKAGSVPGFAYSPALRDAGFVWDAAKLDRWLADPQSLVPGQRMNVLTRDPQMRADIIAYLSANPAAPAAAAP